MSVTVTVNGIESGKELNYFEDAQGMILGTTNIPDPHVLVHLYVIATKPIPKYPYGSIEHPGSMVGDSGHEILIPNGDLKKGPISFEFRDPDGTFHKALSKFNRPTLEMDVTPAMMEDTLEFMDSGKVKECLNDFVEKQWFEYAAIAKKILDQRDQ